MFKLSGDFAIIKSRSLIVTEFFKPTKKEEVACIAIAATEPSKESIRTSLKASTLDGIFAAIFSCVTAEVLLSNFAIELGATNVEIGMLAAIPMLANFLQPIGAYLADRTNSRRWYGLQIISPARLLWLMLVIGIICFETSAIAAHQLVQLTLLVALMTHICSALGCASWTSWMAVLVPRRLRGRYFGLRNSAASLTNLLCVPLLGAIVAHWQGGTIEGYGVVLMLAILAGIASLSFQVFMADVNPQTIEPEATLSLSVLPQPQPLAIASLLKDINFLKFLLYFGMWMFAVNLSVPFFNVYLLKDLGIDISWVTLYNSLTAGANVLMLMFWGKLSDRIGNRPVLISVGLLVAIIPLLWLRVNTDSLSLWLGLPLLYLLGGSTWSGIDLCSYNIQMAIAPLKQSSSYFAIAAAVSGIGGALGTTAGGFLAQSAFFGGISSLFIVSAILRLLALLPLIFVREDLKEVGSQKKILNFEF